MTTAQRVVVDPITRIEGHLRIEAETDADGRITSAYSAGTMVRGIEIILRGRDPRDAWAFAQRICGVCTLVHGIASVRSVEDALHRAIPGYGIPRNAELIRNLMIAAQHVHDHVMHFYHLHALDWVDVVSALKADPKATSALAQSLSSYPRSSPGYFADVQKKVKTFVEQGQLGIFANAYWGHPAYKLPPEANLMAVAHYLDALAWQRDVVKLHAIFGGKNPHPNFVVGGVPSAISVHTRGGGQDATALNMVGLQTVQNVIRQMRDFVDQVYVPDTLAIAGFYKDWAGRGEGLGNFLSFGDLPSEHFWNPDSYLIPRGVILDRDLTRIHPIDLDADNEIQEFVSHSWYKYSQGDAQGLHPFKGETELNYTGPKPPYQQLDVDKKYSWMKSPRWQGKSMEVGPLARVLMLYAGGNARFVLVGDPDPANPASVPEATLSSWHGQHGVEWWGRREDIPAVLQAAHIACLPSSYGEGLPKSLLEAAACGLPIVTSDAPGCREVVRDGVNGLLVPVRDTAALATALRKLIDDAALRRRMGEQSRLRAETEFGLETVIAQTLAVYREVCV